MKRKRKEWKIWWKHIFTTGVRHWRKFNFMAIRWCRRNRLKIDELQLSKVSPAIECFRRKWIYASLGIHSKEKGQSTNNCEPIYMRIYGVAITKQPAKWGFSKSINGDLQVKDSSLDSMKQLQILNGFKQQATKIHKHWYGTVKWFYFDNKFKNGRMHSPFMQSMQITGKLWNGTHFMQTQKRGHNVNESIWKEVKMAKKWQRWHIKKRTRFEHWFMSQSKWATSYWFSKENFHRNDLRRIELFSHLSKMFVC